jgi:large subunit ribosomal protein L13
MKTHVVRAGDIERRWVHIDAEGQVLGRLATVVADVLRGKDKPTYTPHLDTGDFVIVTNCAKVKISGKKTDQRRYYKYSGYQGGLKVVRMRDLVDNKPEDVVYRAVKGMLPHTKLGRAQIKKLRVFAGPEHDHAAQQPQTKSLG